jgi:uncharacterized membrane protein YfcA
MKIQHEPPRFVRDDRSTGETMAVAEDREAGAGRHAQHLSWHLTCADATENRRRGTRVDLAVAVVIGLMAGVLSGMFGVGGGIVMVPAMILLLDFPAHRAVGTSLASLLLPVAIFGVINYARTGNVDFRIAIVLAISLAVAVPLGSHLALSLGNEMLTRLFGGFLLIVAVRFLFFSTG